VVNDLGNEGLDDGVRNMRCSRHVNRIRMLH